MILLTILAAWFAASILTVPLWHAFVTLGQGGEQ